MKSKAASGIMLTLLLLSMLTLTLNIQSAKAEPLPLISLNPMECFVAPGETFTINVNITSVPPLQGYEFKLWFNNTIINVTGADSYGRDLEGNIIPNPLIPISSCAPGKLINGTYYWTPLQNVSDGFIWVLVVFPRGQPFSGSGILVTINFTALTPGVSALHLYDTILADPLPEPIAHATLDGSVTVVPEYIFAIYSLPTGVTFTVDGVSRATPWSETYYEGASVSLEMPKTHNGYAWSHWLEDGDPNRIKTVTIDTDITLTAVYTRPTPVGGKATPINIPMNKPETPTLWIWLTTIILPMVATVVYVKKRKRPTEINS